MQNTLHLSVHMELATACACVAAHDVLHAVRYILRNELELLLQYLCLRKNAHLSCRVCDV